MIPRLFFCFMVLGVLGAGNSAWATEESDSEDTGTTIACGVSAGPDNPFSEAIIKGSEIINESKPIIYALGTLAMLGIGIRAMYGGQMPWGWLFTVIAALVITVMVPAMCTWLYTQVIVPNQSVATYKETAEVIGATGEKLFIDTQQVMFGLGGVAAAAIGIMGLFGKFPFRWLFALTAGLAIITAAAGIVSYLTNS